MKNLIAIAFLLLIFGCKTPQIASTVTETKWRDTVIYVEKKVYVDKIIEVPVPGHTDTLKLTNWVYVDNNQAYMKSIHKEQGIIGVDASIYRSIFNINAYLLDSTILYNYQDTLTLADSIKIADAIREKTSTSTVILPPEKYVPWYYKFTFWYFIITVVIVAAIIFIRSQYVPKIGFLNKLR